MRFGPGSIPASTRRCGSPSAAAGSRFAVSTRRSSRPVSTPVWTRTLNCIACATYITHLTEFGYPERFVQDQAGHRYGSTTAIYTAVSDEYRNRLLTRVLRDQHGDDLYPRKATS